MRFPSAEAKVPHLRLGTGGWWRPKGVRSQQIPDSRPHASGPEGFPEGFLESRRDEDLGARPQPRAARVGHGGFELRS